ncbi:MAG: CHASE3 domain-containing protein [Hyphomicrobiales bacterium]
MPLSLIQKVTFGFAVALLLLLLVGVASYRVIDTMERNADRVAHTHEVVAKLERVSRLAGGAESAARGYVITRSDRFLQPYVTAAGSLLVELDRLKALTRDNPEQARRAKTLDSLVHARLDLLARTVEASRRYGIEAARDSMLSGQGVRTMQGIRDVAAAMETAELRLLASRTAAAQASAGRTKAVILLGMLIAFACVVAALLVIQRDLARRRELEVALERSRDSLEEAVSARTAELRAVIDACPLAVVGIDPEGRVSLWNPAAERILGWREDEVLGRPYPAVPEEEAPQFARIMEHVDRGGSHAGVEVRRRRKDGTHVELSLYSATMRDPAGTVIGRMGVLADLTERKLLEEQLRQSQKMEAIGKLAGGVAHDFNNLLTAILGYSDLLTLRLAADTGRRELAEIRRAADRATALTRQLLAFSRQQVIQPRVLRLDAVVANLESMLGRLIGEDVRLETTYGAATGRVKADPLQLEQVLLNLAVNARDAMPEGGALTIETSETTLDERYAATHPEVEPGRYVVLAVSDTGIGMDAETRRRIFEPFFTTKEVGKGTGLGLSTVYGIVKQSGGHMTVYSEPGQGATFRVYLPRVEDAAEPLETAGAASPSDAGWETVLVVEDERSLLKLVTEILRDAGYTVLPAGGATEALQHTADHPGKIHLLLTDVIMPGRSGPALAAELTRLLPGIRVLYMSGYTSNAIVHHGVLDPGVNYLEKPFTPGALTRRVRETLDARPSASPSEGASPSETASPPPGEPTLG